MKRIFPQKRKDGYVIVEYTGYKITSSAKRIWPKALDAPRKPKKFATYKEANAFIKAVEDLAR